ncbi:MAG: hypothetical protein HZC24_06145 [Rhodocyclales bacterium]|nr:hypothetical protein [Rhodocyclales bacterium]
MSAPVFDPGCLRLRLLWRDGRAGAVDVALARPNAVVLLRGRPADEAARLLPLLYSICGAAQGAAAALALRAARGETVAAGVAAAVLAEAQREHLWRLLLDWPKALALPGREAQFIAARRRLQQGDSAAAVAASLQETWRGIAAALGAQAPVAAHVPMLPPLTAAQTLALWPRLDAGFAAAPTYRGVPAETGALARHPDLAAAADLLDRVGARLADFAEGTGLGATSAASVAPGIGRAAVETARGLLLHELVLDGDRIADYVIVAPSEWNFHPAGALHAWLQGAAAASADELRRRAALAVLALDPCVRSEIEVREA